MIGARDYDAIRTKSVGNGVKTSGDKRGRTRQASVTLVDRLGAAAGLSVGWMHCISRM